MREHDGRSLERVLQLGGVGWGAPHSHEHVGRLALVGRLRLGDLSLKGNEVSDDKRDEIRRHLDRRRKSVQQKSGANGLWLLVVEIAHVAENGQVFRRGDGYLKAGK